MLWVTTHAKIVTYKNCIVSLIHVCPVTRSRHSKFNTFATMFFIFNLLHAFRFDCSTLPNVQTTLTNRVINGFECIFHGSWIGHNTKSYNMKTIILCSQQKCTIIYMQFVLKKSVFVWIQAWLAQLMTVLQVFGVA